MTSAFEHLSGPNKPLRTEPPDERKFEGLIVRLDITKNSSPRTVPLTKAATTTFQAAISGHKSLQMLKRLRICVLKI